MARRNGASFASGKFQSSESSNDFLNAVVDLPFYELSEALSALQEFLPAVIAVVSENLAKGGATAAKKQLLNAETPWGRARMAGEAYGIRFKSYGKGPGRYDTGRMYESIESRMEDFKYSGARAVFGYKQGAPAYVYAQERGFLSSGTFDAKATKADGVARFESGKPKWRKGAFAIPAGMKRVQRLWGSAMSAAWNEAIKQWESAGYGNASSAGTFKQSQRKRPSFNRTEGSIKRQIEQVDDAVAKAIRSDSGDSAIFGRLEGGSQMWWNTGAVG